jgi:O-antigen/teichoic acid export membrane protein
VLAYTVLSGAAAVAALGKTLAYGAFMSPVDLGGVVLALLVVAAAGYPATFGLQDALVREVPILRGAGVDPVGVRSAVLTGVLVLACVVGVAISIACGAIAPESSLIWCGPLLTATVLFNLAVADLQTRELSIIQAAMLLGKSLVPLVIVVSYGERWTTANILQMEMLVQTTLGAAALLVWREGLHWRPDGSEWRRLARIGLPFAGNSAVQHVALHVDRWAVEWSSGRAALGLYGFAMQLASVGLVTLNITQLYVTPRLLRRMATEGDAAQLVQSMRRWRRITLAAGVAVAVVSVLVAPIAIARGWPAYVDARRLLPIISVGAVAIALSFYDVFFLAAGNGRAMLPVQGLAVAVTAAMCAAAMWLDAGLFGFACAFAAGRLATVVMGWWLGNAVLMASGSGRSTR